MLSTLKYPYLRYSEESENSEWDEGTGYVYLHRIEHIFLFFNQIRFLINFVTFG